MTPGFSATAAKLAERLAHPNNELNYQETLSALFREPIDENAASIMPDNLDTVGLPSLPPGEELFTEIREYFSWLNSLVPLYHEFSFYQSLYMAYEKCVGFSTELLASIYVMIAMVHSRKAGTSLEPQVENQRAWAYFSAASSMFPHLVMMNDNMSSIQAILGMGDGKAAHPLTTAALRSSYQIGLHKQDSVVGLDPGLLRQRTRVFQIAYILDLRSCIHNGFQSLHVDEEIDRSAIDGMVICNQFAERDNGDATFFQAVVFLTLITCRVLRQFYSERMSSPSRIEHMLHTFYHQLEGWRQTVPFQIKSPFDTGTPRQHSDFADTWLQLSYYHALMVVNRLPFRRQMEQVPFATDIPFHSQYPGDVAEPQLPMIYNASSLSRDAASACLSMISNTTCFDTQLIWVLIYYVFEAASVIFTAILEDKQDPSCIENLSLLRSAASFFSALVSRTSCTQGEVYSMCKVCNGFVEIVENTIRTLQPFDSQTPGNDSAAFFEWRDEQTVTPQDSAEPIWPSRSPMVDMGSDHISLSSFAAFENL
ncbi:hypothetical protein N7457_006565 [Penicillium paradoxum]|uniref:uncharacterized protein n=1 Tax=Penicillium paradoxum TaxID=176176 RepID=UPI002548FCE3|nr:uncharacterized protein N7457_006565 [Penicillium paradoxum]KAJ5778845.1 hypothetical protein N7457_006565 [Penicillium paradoxum]